MYYRLVCVERFFQESISIILFLSISSLSVCFFLVPLPFFLYLSEVSDLSRMENSVPQQLV